MRDGPDGYELPWRLEGAILDINDVLIVFIIQKRILNDEPAKNTLSGYGNSQSYL